MDNSFFSSQIQEVFSQLLLDLFDRYNTDDTKSAVEEKWVLPGKVTKQSSSTSSSSKSSSLSSSSFEDLIQEASARYDVDADLVRAVIKAESNFNPDAVSSSGAQGLMQLMPATAASLGVDDPLDPEENIDGGVRLLSNLLERYDDNVSLALAAYNAGPGAVDKYGGIPPYQETQTYVTKILGYLDSEQTWSA